MISSMMSDSLDHAMVIVPASLNKCGRSLCIKIALIVKLLVSSAPFVVRFVSLSPFSKIGESKVGLR